MSERLVISPLARVRWLSGRLEISAAGREVRLCTSDSDLLSVLHSFAQPKTIEEVEAEFSLLNIPWIASELRSAGVLIFRTEAIRIESSYWDVDALAFHRRSRAEISTEGVPPVSPPVAPAQKTGTVIPLDRPFDVAPRDLASILDARRSRRSWSSEPTPHLGGLLWFSARNRSSEPNVVSRSYPSGGAAYSLELYLVLGPKAVPAVPAGIYRYRPQEHTLELVSRNSHGIMLQAAAAAVGAERVPIMLVVTSRFERVSSTYRELAYSLVLKEVGALFQTLYLVAEYLGLAVCALGQGCPDRAFAGVIGTDDLVEPVVGEMVIGPA